MPQLLVRDIDDAIVRKLKQRAAAHGVSAEEEHRRILKSALAKPAKGELTLIEFLLADDAVVHPETELGLSRSRELETRKTGF